MSRFLIGQVCNALGVRAHVLRYWERHVELLSPAKDLSGRRMYTLRDVQLLFRLKYLVYTRGMSVEGASRKLVEEVQGGGQNRKAALDSLRGDLFRVSLGAQRLGEHLEDTTGAAAAGRGETRRPTHVEAVAAELRRIVLDASRPTAAARGEPGGPEAAANGGVVRAARHTGDEDFAAARSLLRRAPVLVVSPAPAVADTVERYPGLLPLLGRGGETVLDRIGRRLSALAREFGHEPLWMIGASQQIVAAVRGHVARRSFYGLSAARVRVYEEPRLPYLSAEGHPLTVADGSQPVYELPLLSGLRTAARHVDDTADLRAPSKPSVSSGVSKPSEPFGLTLIVPVTNALPRIPDLEFISRHLDTGVGVSVKAARVSGADGPADPTGEALLSTGMCAVVPRDIPGEVRRFRGEDDILEIEGTRGRFEMEQLLEAADIGLIFEIDARAEVASLRSPADWDACSQLVRERS